ncbi:hypothetical protein SESBI_12556 [Sesbania bispinosa]|nr:hypothetical protein SESBI_12556 [Sesbania bispinosa]
MAQIWGYKFQVFHASIIQRRGRNKIMKIQDTSEVWREGSKEILKVVEVQHAQLFTACNPNESLDLNSIVPTIISEEVNNALTCLPSEGEIQAAADSLGDLKAPSPDDLQRDEDEDDKPDLDLQISNGKRMRMTHDMTTVGARGG